MKIATGHKTFDLQALRGGIFKGNVISNVQRGNYIRPQSETKNGWVSFEPGQLNKYDLDLFENLPSRVRSKVQELTKTESGILYEIRHWRKGKKILHGYIFTKTHSENYELVCDWWLSNRQKSVDIMMAMRHNLCK